MIGAIKTAAMLVAEQAKDPGLWFRAQFITEAHLQTALRALHAAVEEDALRPFPAGVTDEQLEAVYASRNIPVPRVSAIRPDDERRIDCMNQAMRQAFLDAARDLVKLGRDSA